MWPVLKKNCPKNGAKIFQYPRIKLSKTNKKKKKKKKKLQQKWIKNS